MPDQVRNRVASNFSIQLLTNALATNAPNPLISARTGGNEAQSDLDLASLNFDEESAIAGSRRDKGYSFTGASESEIRGDHGTDNDEGEGGYCRDADMADMESMKDLLGIDGVERL